MAKDESDDRSDDEWSTIRRRERATLPYQSTIAGVLANASRIAGANGLDHRYESTVDDLGTDIPSRDKTTHRVNERLLAKTESGRRQILARARQLDIELDPPLAEIPKNPTYGEYDDYLEEKLVSECYDLDNDNPSDMQLIQRIGALRSLLKKQAYVDLLDETGQLRSRTSHEFLGEDER